MVEYNFSGSTTFCHHDINSAHTCDYPFTMLKACSTIPAELTELLPPRHEILRILRLFNKQGLTCSPIHTFNSLAEVEVERFLDGLHQDAGRCPAMLGLLFAVMAIAAQSALYDRCSEHRKRSPDQSSSSRGDCYGGCPTERAYFTSVLIHAKSLQAFKLFATRRL